MTLPEISTGITPTAWIANFPPAVFVQLLPAGGGGAYVNSYFVTVNSTQLIDIPYLSNAPTSTASFTFDSSTETAWWASGSTLTQLALLNQVWSEVGAPFGVYVICANLYGSMFGFSQAAENTILYSWLTENPADIAMLALYENTYITPGSPVVCVDDMIVFVSTSRLPADKLITVNATTGDIISSSPDLSFGLNSFAYVE